MDNRLSNFSAIYTQHFMRQTKYTQVLVNIPLFQSINHSFFKIRDMLGHNLSHSNIEFLDYEMRCLFYTYGTSIVPLNNLYYIDKFNYLLDVIKEDYEPFLNDTSLLKNLLINLTKLFEHDEHPFLIALKEIFSHTSYGYTIVTKNSLTEKEKNEVKQKFPQYSITFLTYIEYSKNIIVHDNVIFIGSPKLYEDVVLEHINANHFYFILFSSYFSEVKFVPWLTHDRIIKNFDVPVFKIKEINYPLEPLEKEAELDTEKDLPNLEVEEPALPKSVINSLITSDFTGKKEKLVECKLVELEGNEFLFEEIGTKAKCDVINSSLLYERKHLNEVESNEYMILIDFHEWNDRKKFADSYFEEKGISKDRENLARLKRYHTC